MGYEALSTEDAHGNNVAVGNRALKNLNAGTAALNVGVGDDAGQSLTTGLYNTLIGGGAGDALTDADSNVAMGQNSLSGDTLGSHTTAIGQGALANQNFTTATSTLNTAVGYDAGSAVSTGKASTFIGANAGANVSTGLVNTFIGASCGIGNSSNKLTGSNNTAVGQGALQDIEGSGDGNTCIGRDSGTAITTGVSNVLLGYANQVSSATVVAEIVIGPGVTGSGGSTVTIGSGAGKISNTFTSNATWSHSSDERLKTNIQDDTLGLSFINRLNPVTYNWKPSNDIDKSLPYYKEENERDTNVTMHGLVAQEVKTALDAEGVDTFAGWGEGLDGVQTISREMFVSPLIKSIQELSTKLDAALARIATLEG